MTFDAKLFSGIGVFAAVAETGSFVKAGSALGITGSGVSRAISRLERRLGARLFERSSRAVSLTDEGKRFYDRVRPLLEGAESAASDLTSEQSVIRGRLRITVDAPSANFILAGALPSLRQVYPELSLDIVVCDTLGDLVSDGFDAALRFGDVEAQGLRRIYLASTRIVTVASPELCAKQSLPNHPAGLDALPCILMRDPLSGIGFAWQFLGKSERFEIRPGPGLMVNDGNTLLAACVEGSGVAQLLEIEACTALKSGQLVQYFEDWGQEMYPLALYISARSVQPVRIKALITHMKSRCNQLIAQGQLFA